MEKSEPTLVPEWLKATPGSSTSNISTSNSSLYPSSSLRSGQRNKLAVSSSDHDFSRSASLVERTSSSAVSHRSTTSNGSGAHGKANLNSSRSYNISRRNRDKCLDRELDHYEKERLLDDGYLDSPIVSIAERAALQRSKSQVTRIPTDSWPKKVNNDATNSSISVRNSMGSIGRSSFEREFPSLGSDEKLSSPEITRVSSPALVTVPQIPLLSSSTVIGGEGWTSCLADVPSRVANSGALLVSVNHSAPVSSVLVSPTASSSLNMAETVAQAPMRARTTPQVSVETQRLEELAIKQSKQLIPMTPSLPKVMASNLDKSKLKGTRTADISGMPKGITQSSSLLSHPLRSTPRPDVSKNPQVGNFQVLNREKNCLSPTAKEIQNLTNGTKILSTHSVPSSVNALSKKTSNFLRESDLKGSGISLAHCPNLDKKPSPHAQDRNDFFNSLRKKAPVNSSTAWQPNHCSTSSSAAEKTNDQNIGSVVSDCQAIDTAANAFLDYSGAGSDSLNENCKAFFKEPEISHQNEDKGEDSFHSSVVPEEKEFEFLRSLGWVEDDGEEAITPEEIASFYSKLRKQVMSPESSLPGSMNKLAGSAAQAEESSSCNSGEA